VSRPGPEVVERRVLRQGPNDDHLQAKNPSRARYWWIRTGTLDTNTAHTVVGNLASITTKLGDTVNSALYWDGGHAVNFDSPDLIEWIGKLTGYSV
jgi:hypothetical protein